MNNLTEFLDGTAPDAPARIRAGAGVVIGGVFVMFLPVLLLVWWMSGPEHVSRDGMRMRLDLLSLFYPLGAIVTGALFFLFAGFVRSRVGKSLVGVLAFLPWMAGLALCINHGYEQWTALHTALSLFGAGAFGAPLGWHASDLTTRADQSTSARRAV